VDYFKFGACRLVDVVQDMPGTYYCGAVALGAPHKGLTSTVETVEHLGTKLASANHPVDGDMKFKASNYEKLQTPLNKAYYTEQSSGNNGKDNFAYTHHVGNNGQRLGWATHVHSDHDTSTTALYNNGELLQPIKMSYNHDTAAATVASGVTNFNANSASNYAMTPGAAAQYAGVHFATGSNSWAFQKGNLQ